MRGCMLMASFSGKKEHISFHELNKDVIEKGICAMCQGCFCFCSADELNALMLEEDKPVYYDEENCLKCGICYMICPKTMYLEDVVKSKFKFKLPIGSYEEARCLRATDDDILEVCCDGGVVTSLLKFMVDEKYIHGAIISKRTGLWSNQPMLATTYKELLECAGTSLSQSVSIAEMGILTTYVPILATVKGLRVLDVTKLALVGTPCQIKTIRKMQVLRIVPSHIVSFTIGLFCFENFSLQSEGIKYLEGKIGAGLDEVVKINLKEDFIVRLKDGRTIHIDLEDLKPLVRPACLACTDFSNFASDISVGGVGSPDGYTTTLIRSPEARRIVDEALRKGYLEEVERKGMIETIGKMALRKIRRGSQVLKEKGVSTDL